MLYHIFFYRISSRFVSLNYSKSITNNAIDPGTIVLTPARGAFKVNQSSCKSPGSPGLGGFFSRLFLLLLLISITRRRTATLCRHGAFGVVPLPEMRIVCRAVYSDRLVDCISFDKYFRPGRFFSRVYCVFVWL